MKGVRKFGGKAGSFKKKGQSAHSGKKFMRKRPVRRGQLISPFGVGSIMDFRNDEALMCAGTRRLVYGGAASGMGHE